MLKKSILLVEDNPQDELLILRALKKIDMVGDVNVVRDGQQAIDYIFSQGEFADREGQDMPAIIVLDLSLPRLNGVEVLERLRADSRSKLLPVTVFTSSSEECDRLACYRNGANSFVSKPHDFAEFTDAVIRMGLYWMRINRPPLTGACFE